jgi:hypothetical protein
MNEPREFMRDSEEQEVPSLEKIKNVLQRSVLTDYPNPERKGCLALSEITRIAEQRLPHEHTQWQHISHCSPCYREFLDHRTEFKRDLKRAAFRRRLMIWTGIGAIALLGLTALMALLKTH